MKDLAEVCPLSRGMMVQSLSVPLQDGIRFFRVPLPASLSASLARSFPFWEQYGFSVFRASNRCGLGPLSSPVALVVHEGG
jgi:hypothetical protein